MENSPSFLGNGWAFPPAFFNGGADIAMASGAADIKQSLEILLSTNLRERNMHHDFGCELEHLLFEEINQNLASRITDIVSNAILHHEPRIEVEDINIDKSDAEEGLLLISIDYTVRSTNSRYNMVYPFYLNEASGSLIDAME